MNITQIKEKWLAGYGTLGDMAVESPYWDDTAKYRSIYGGGEVCINRRPSGVWFYLEGESTPVVGWDTSSNCPEPLWVRGEGWKAGDLLDALNNYQPSFTVLDRIQMEIKACEKGLKNAERGAASLLQVCEEDRNLLYEAALANHGFEEIADTARHHHRVWESWSRDVEKHKGRLETLKQRLQQASEACVAAGITTP